MRELNYVASFIGRFIATTDVVLRTFWTPYINNKFLVFSDLSSEVFILMGRQDWAITTTVQSYITSNQIALDGNNLK